MIGNNIKMPTGWTNDKEGKTARLLFYNLDRGLARRRQELPRWDRNEAYENAQMWFKAGKLAEGEGDQVTVNKIASIINTKMASTLFKNPRVVVQPRDPAGWQEVPLRSINPQTGAEETRTTARYKVLENLINYLADQPAFGLNSALRLMYKAGWLGYGAVKVGYLPSFENPPPQDEQQIPKDPETGLPDLSGYQTDPETGALLRDEHNRLIPLQELVAEKWFVDWVPYRQLIIDPDGGNNPRDHRWIAYEYVRRLEDVKRDKLLKNTKDLKATGNLEDDGEGQPRGYEYKGNTENDPWLKDTQEAIRLFEIFDLEKKRIIVLADGCSRILRDDPIPAGIDLMPYVFFRPNQILDEFYQRPLATDICPLVQEYCIHRTQAVVAARRNIGKILVEEGALDTKELNALTSDVHNALVMNKSGKPNSEVITAFSWPPVAQDAWLSAERALRDIDEIAQSPSEARGVARAKTATQVQVLESHDIERNDDMRNLLGQAIIEIFKKLGDSIQENMNLQQAITVVGEDGQLWTALVGHEDIVGDYDYSMDITELTPRNSQVEIAQFVNALGIFAQAPWLLTDPQGTAAILDKLNIKDTRLRDAMVRASQMFMQQQQAPPPGQAEGVSAPESEAQMLAQEGGRVHAGV